MRLVERGRALGCRVAWAILALVPGACQASAEPLRLTWMWNRPPAQRALVRVVRVEAEGGGLFGFKRSPSMADALPDAQVLTATLLPIDGGRAGRAVVVRLPKRELPAHVAAGQTVALGYTQDGAAVCIAALPPDVGAGAQRDWLERWTCSEK